MAGPSWRRPTRLKLACSAGRDAASARDGGGLRRCPISPPSIKASSARTSPSHCCGEYVQATAGPTYQYSRFCDLYRDFARASSARCARCTAPARSFIDYAGDTVPIVDAETGEISAQIFVACSGPRTTPSPAPPPRSRRPTGWGAGAPLRFIGGVPELIVPDNTASMVGEPDRYAPQLQRTTAAKSSPSTTAWRSCPHAPASRRTRARWSGRTDRAALDPGGLRHRRFFSLAELDVAIAGCRGSQTHAPSSACPAIVAAPSRRSTSRRCVRCPPRRSSSPSGRRPAQHRLSRRVRRPLLQRAHALVGRCWASRHASPSSASPADAVWRCMPAATGAAPSARSPSTCPLAPGPPPVVAQQAHRLGATVGPYTERGRLPARTHAAPRTGLPRLPGADAPGPPVRQRTAGGRRRRAVALGAMRYRRTSPRC